MMGKDVIIGVEKPMEAAQDDGSSKIPQPEESPVICPKCGRGSLGEAHSVAWRDDISQLWLVCLKCGNYIKPFRTQEK
jgi:hypothetical protein